MAGPTSVLHGSLPGGALAASTTYALLIGDGRDGGTTVLSEPSQDVVFQTAGTMSGLNAFFSVYDRGTGTIKTRTSSTYGGTVSDGAQSASITGSGLTTDVTHTESVSAGTFWNWTLVTGSGGTASNLFHGGVLFAATSSSKTISKFAGGATPGTLVVNASYFQTPTQGVNTTNTGSLTEGQYQVILKSAGTWRNLWANITTNGVAATSSIFSRVNTANGGQSASITASTTGHFEDVSGTDSITSGQKISKEITVGNSAGTFTVASFGSEFETANNTQSWVGSTSTSGGDTTAAAGTNNVCPMSDGQGNGTLSRMVMTPAVAVVVTHLQVQVMANSLTAGHVTTFTVLKNSSAGSGAVSNTAQTTGYLEDTTGSDSLNSTDTVAIQAVAPAGGTSISYNGFGLLATFTAPATGTVKHRVVG